MSTASLTRRKSSALSSSSTTSSVSSTNDSDGGGACDHQRSSSSSSSSSLLLLAVEEQQPKQQQRQHHASRMTRSLLSALLSPLKFMEPPIPAAPSTRTTTLTTTATTTSKVVAEECSSDDGSLWLAEDDEEEEEQSEEDDRDFIDVLLSDAAAAAADEENVVSSKNTNSDSPSSSSKHHPQSSTQLVVVDKPGFRKRLALIRLKRAGGMTTTKEIDVQAYMSKREMTVTQERWNAITVIPNPLFCFYFLLGGLWVSADLVNQARRDYNESDSSYFSSFSADYSGSSSSTGAGAGFGGFLNDMLGDEHGCLNNAASSSLSSPSWWQYFIAHMMILPPALPPLPAMAVALGITLHAPWSVLYHWKYAHALPAGAARTQHWSRRMDQSMIHVASAIIAYGTSGSWDYFVANVLYNADCVYRQLHEQRVRPRRNKVRLLISVIAYTLPIVWHEGHDNWFLFGQLWIVLLVGFWLFGLYPIGGWSHCVFHLVAMLLPPLLMQAACRLPVAQDQMKLAAQCVVWAEQQ